MNEEQRRRVWKIFWRKKATEVGWFFAIAIGSFVAAIILFYIGLLIPVCGMEYKGMQDTNGGDCSNLLEKQAYIDCQCSGGGFYFLNVTVGLLLLLGVGELFIIILLIVAWLQYNWKEAKKEAKVK